MQLSPKYSLKVLLSKLSLSLSPSLSVSTAEESKFDKENLIMLDEIQPIVTRINCIFLPFTSRGGGGGGGGGVLSFFFLFFFSF